MNILAIESSCDETACAVVKDGVHILSNVVASSHEMHEKYGGIVPEVAARKQLESIIPVIMEATKDLSYDTIAVTVGPGLIGSLLVGVETAKTIAFVTDKPIIPVNHVLAHMYANFVSSAEQNSSRGSARDHHKIEFPAISLVVSGGHTELYLMKSPKHLTWLGGTIDDAAGECFDKAARLLGFGNGGGLAIQQHAKKGDVPKLPRPMLDKKNELNFSFSGLKTAVLRAWQANPDPALINALAYEVQEAITDVLVKKTLRAADRFDAKSILLSGGVASNLRLREKLPQAIAPPIELCTDNAVYIAAYAFFRGKAEDWKTITAEPDLAVEIISKSPIHE